MDYRLWILFIGFPSKKSLLKMFCFFTSASKCSTFSFSFRCLSFFFVCSEAFLVMCTDGFRVFARLLSDRRRPRPGWRWCQRLRIRLGFKEILSFRNSIKSLFRFAQSNEIRYFKPFMDVLHVELSSGPTHQSYRFPKRRRNFLSVKYLLPNIEILSAAAVKL